MQINNNNKVKKTAININKYYPCNCSLPKLLPRIDDTNQNHEMKKMKSKNNK